MLTRSTLKAIPQGIRNILNLKVRVNLNGQTLIIPIGAKGGLENVFWDKTWKTELIERLVNPADGPFIDVGANIGQTLLDLRAVRPKAAYVGFEPNAACVSYLQELIQTNAFENCQVVPVGLSQEIQILPLYRQMDLAIDSGSTLLAGLRPNKPCHIDFVPCFRFDDLRHSLGIEKIGFVKIDVEGAELETIAGMQLSLRQDRPVILCEVLFTSADADLKAQTLRNESLMQLLVDLGYSVLQLVKSGDDRQIIEATKIQEFPAAYWSLKNKDLCDYLFVPQEKSEVLTRLLVSHSGRMNDEG